MANYIEKLVNYTRNDVEEKKAALQTFSRERFMNFARFDLAINRTFYRNLVLVTVIGALGIAAVCFAGRYFVWQTSFVMDPRDGAMLHYATPNSFDHYNNMFFTTVLLGWFLGIMSIIFAGCWAHNLRNKQGRITELTLPATNLEKFLWHIALMIGGGTLLCIASLLLADGFNALLTACFCPADDGIGSITSHVLTIMSGDTEEILKTLGMYFGQESTNESSESAICFMSIAVSLCNLAIYFFGNAVKYKYNIIWTYVIIYSVQTVVILLTFSGLSIADNTIDVSLSPTQVVHGINIAMYTVGGIALALAITLPLWSYDFYTKAQITSKRNK